MVTSLPASARTRLNAVPQEPAPKTATLLIYVFLFLLVGVADLRDPRRPRVEAYGGCLLAAQLLDQRGDRSHDPVGRLVQHLGGHRLVHQVAQVDRVADLVGGGLAREQVRPLGVRRQQVLHPPLPDRDHRAPRCERDPGGAGLATHRPAVGVLRDRALGIDPDALPMLDRLDRSVERRDRPLAHPRHGDLLGVLDDVLDHRRAEQRVLGEVADQPPVVVEEQPEGHRVQVRDVVDHHHAATGGRDLLAVAPVAFGQRHQRRLEDADDGRERPATLLAQLSGLSHPASSWSRLASSRAYCQTLGRHGHLGALAGTLTLTPGARCHPG